MDQDFRPSEEERTKLASHSEIMNEWYDVQARMARQDLISSIRQVAREAEATRKENINLKMQYSELADQLVGLQKANSHLAVHRATSYYAARHSGLGLGLGTGRDVDSMLYPRSSYFGGDMQALVPSEQEQMMLAYRSNLLQHLLDLQAHISHMYRQDLVPYLEQAAMEAQALWEEIQENTNLKIKNSELASELTAAHNATPYYAAEAAGPSGLAVRPPGYLTAQRGHNATPYYAAEAAGPSGLAVRPPGYLTTQRGHNATPYYAAEAAGPSGLAVRPPGYLTTQRGHNATPYYAAEAAGPSGLAVRPPGYLTTQRGESGPEANKQEVLVSGGQKEEEALELGGYYQGMMKTELCKHWERTGGKCPFGEQCRFAHGVQEQRPIIRHPRYKTEVCHMILNGVHCPYGHRCHFRHSF